MENSYYVYTLARPDGMVFYVGKGKGYRIQQHETEAKRGVKSRKCDIIRQVWEQGGKVLKTKIKEGLTEGEAFELEYQTILQYGQENLTNEKVDPYSVASRQASGDIIREVFGNAVADMVFRKR